MNSDGFFTVWPFGLVGKSPVLELQHICAVSVAPLKRIYPNCEVNVVFKPTQKAACVWV